MGGHRARSPFELDPGCVWEFFILCDLWYPCVPTACTGCLWVSSSELSSLTPDIDSNSSFLVTYGIRAASRHVQGDCEHRARSPFEHEPRHKRRSSFCVTCE